MEQERGLGFREPAPERREVDVTRRPLPRRMVGNPDGLQSGAECEVEFLQRELGVFQRHDADPHQPMVVCAELAHRPVVGASRAVADLVGELATRRERRGDTVRGEHELLAKAEHVERHGAVVAVECTERLDLLGLRDQLVAECDLRLDVFGSMPLAVGDDLIHLVVGDQRRGVADLGDLLADRRVGVVAQEVRQLHDVAVRVVERPVRWCVGHVCPVLRLRAQSVKR